MIFFTLQVTWTRGERPISSRTAAIAWTRVTTCAKRGLKWRGSDDLPRATWQPEDFPIGTTSDGSRNLHRTADLPRNSGARDRLITIVHPAFLSSDDADKTRKNLRIAVRSSRDRAAIAARSSRDRGAIEPRSYAFWREIASTGSNEDWRRPRTTIEARSWPDRGPIVVRSWC